MHAEFVALRLIHILSAITWLGGGIFTTFFLIPAVSSSPAVMGQVLEGLQRRRYFAVVQIVAALTILSGLRLMWIDSAGFSGSYFDTAMGKTLGNAGLAAIIAAVLSIGVARPAMVRAGALAASLAGSADPGEKARISQQLDRLRRRGMIATLASVGFGILAAMGMAVARYI